MKPLAHPRDDRHGFLAVLAVIVIVAIIVFAVLGLYLIAVMAPSTASACSFVAHVVLSGTTSPVAGSVVSIEVTSGSVRGITSGGLGSQVTGSQGNAGFAGQCGIGTTVLAVAHGGSTSPATKAGSLGSATAILHAGANSVTIGLPAGSLSATSAGRRSPSTIALIRAQASLDFTASCVDLTCTFYPVNSANGTTATWNFGDGQVSVQPAVAAARYTYATAGNYTVSLTSGGSSVSHTVNVKGARNWPCGLLVAPAVLLGIAGVKVALRGRNHA